MVKNHRLSKSISDVSWYELTRQLEYKAKWNGRKYVKIDTFYASSQLCSVCGYQNTETKNLSVREWTCPVSVEQIMTGISTQQKYTGRRIKTNSSKNNNIGQGLPELTPVEIVGYEVCEAGSPLALDNG